MKILSVICFYPPYEPSGGATVYAHSLNKALLSLGNEVKVFCGKLDDKIPEGIVENDTFENISITRISLNYQSFGLPLRRLYGINKITEEFSKVLKSFNPNIVHFHSIQGLGADLVTKASSLGFKTAITIHDSWWICPRQFFLKSDKKTFCNNKNCVTCSVCYSLLENKFDIKTNIKKEAEILLRDKYLYQVFNLIDIKVFPSNFIKQIYQKHIKESKWIVSQNGIEPPNISIKRKKTNNNLISFLFVGGSSVEKGSTLLLNTWKKYFFDNDKIRLNLYGAGSESFKNSSLPKNVKILGTYSFKNKAKVFLENDILIFPSLIPENSPITIKEAFSYGLPVIASNVGGIPEIVNNLHNGYIFNSNSSEDLFNKINLILKKDNYDKLLSNLNKSYTNIQTQAENLLKIFSQQATPPKKQRYKSLFSLVTNNFYKHKINSNLPIVRFKLFKETHNMVVDKPTLVFNLDANEFGKFVKYLKFLNIKEVSLLHEIYKDSLYSLKTNSQTLLNKNKINNWITIYKLIKLKKIQFLVLPISDISHFKLANTLIMLFSGIKTFISINKNIYYYKFQPSLKFKIDKDIISNFYKCSKAYIHKLILHTIFFIPWLTLSLLGLFFTPYGLKRFLLKYFTTYIALTRSFIKHAIYQSFIVPLKILRYISNAILFNYLLK